MHAMERPIVSFLGVLVFESSRDISGVLFLGRVVSICSDRPEKTHSSLPHFVLLRVICVVRAVSFLSSVVCCCCCWTFFCRLRKRQRKEKHHCSLQHNTQEEKKIQQPTQTQTQEERARSRVILTRLSFRVYPVYPALCVVSPSCWVALCTQWAPFSALS